MFVSSVLKKCANFITHNDNSKDGPTSKSEENSSTIMGIQHQLAGDSKENLNLSYDCQENVSNFMNNKRPDSSTSANNTAFLDCISLKEDQEDILSEKGLLFFSPNQDDYESRQKIDEFETNLEIISIDDSITTEECYNTDNLQQNNQGISFLLTASKEEQNLLLENDDLNELIHNDKNQKLPKARPSVLAYFDPLFSNSSTESEKLTLIVKEQTELPILTNNAGNNVSTDIDNKQLTEQILEAIVDKAIAVFEETGSKKPLGNPLPTTMAEINDKLTLQEEENAELKLQLNASQQVRATLELQLRQKEEIIIKSQTETLRKDQAFKQEIKQLKEKLEQKSVETDNAQTKELQETVKLLKAREAKLLSELNTWKNDEQNYRRILEEYEKTITTQAAEIQKLTEEYETVKQHLANLELAFSDVHQKYERSKKIIDGYKSNEDALRQTLIATEDSVIKSEEKYESLKAHAKAQIEKSNQELQLIREQYESEIHKLSAINKRLEIKIASVKDLLEQKTKECTALAALCDEVTGKV